MSSENDDIVEYPEGRFNYTKDRWVGKGSVELNRLGTRPPARSQSDET
jgi:hypothetical protein